MANMTLTKTPMPEQDPKVRARNFEEVASMVGMARKKENSAAAPRLRPRSIAPRIVAPDREVPGIMERHWNRPMYTATDQEMSPVRRMVGWVCRLRSRNRKATPYRISVTATVM